MTETQEWTPNTYSGSPDGIPNNLQELEMVLCGFRDGTVLYSRAGYFSWLQHGTDGDIIRYMKITADDIKVLNKEYEDILRNIQ